MIEFLAKIPRRLDLNYNIVGLLRNPFFPRMKAKGQDDLGTTCYDYQTKNKSPSSNHYKALAG